ncbi:MAG: response regulator, partial [Methylococcales bacterium]|nr:response regulator [Methylococcales bacterium]
MAEKIKVLVVDDASFMVKAISEILNSDPDIEVVGSAKNGLLALEQIKLLHPDVITLDVDMPVMDGIKAVRHIMLECPVPIVMLSSLFSNGAISFEALRLGVVDFLPKPSGAISRDIHESKQQIIERIKLAYSVNIKNVHRVKIQPFSAQNKLNHNEYQHLDHLLLVGTTLGGPNTSIRLFSQLSPKL